MKKSFRQNVSTYGDEGTKLRSDPFDGFDPAGNLIIRTNNALRQGFQVNALNELTANTNGGSLTVMGTTTSTSAGVTVNGDTAAIYDDATFVKTGLSFTTNYTAVATDAYGRYSTNSVTVNLSTNVAFQYDANGNLTNDGLLNLAYDDENQLIQVWVSNQWMSKFTYDAKMRRRTRDEYIWSSAIGNWTLTNEVRYVYDGNLVIQERDMNNLPTTTYTRGKDLSGSLEGAGGIGGLLARTAQAYVDAPLAGHSFYHADANGNVTMLINGYQTIVAKYLYDAFGNILSKSGLLADANRYQFSSKEKDLNSGLVYYLYRYYDPSLQRWANKDQFIESGFEKISRFLKDTSPSGYAQLGDELNLYCFVNNQPTLAFDVLGLAPATGPNTPACKQAVVNAALAIAIWKQSPTQKNLEGAQDAIAAATAACSPPTPPPYCPGPGGFQTNPSGYPPIIPPIIWLPTAEECAEGALCVLAL